MVRLMPKRQENPEILREDRSESADTLVGVRFTATQIRNIDLIDYVQGSRGRAFVVRALVTESITNYAEKLRKAGYKDQES